LKGIEDAANEEIEAKRTGFASEREQRQKQSQAEMQSSQQVFGSYDKLLVEKFPQYFAKQEGNDEFNNALDQGVKYVDDSSKDFNAKTPEQRAQSAAMIRRWASVWPANQILLKQNAAKIADLEATILKLQGSDPGTAGESGAGPATGGEAGGTDGLGDEFQRLTSQV
jgi:hypothetical protein